MRGRAKGAKRPWPFLPIGKKASSYRGPYRVSIFIRSVCPPVRLSVFMYSIRRFTGCESCARPIFTNPESMGACNYRLTRGSCFVARHLEVVADAELRWI